MLPLPLWLVAEGIFRPTREEKKAGGKDKSSESGDGRGETRDKTRSRRAKGCARGGGGGGARRRQEGARGHARDPPAGRPDARPSPCPPAPGHRARAGGGAWHGRRQPPGQRSPLGRAAPVAWREREEQRSGPGVEEGTGVSGVGVGKAGASPRSRSGRPEGKKDTRTQRPSSPSAPRSGMALTVRARSRWTSGVGSRRGQGWCCVASRGVRSVGADRFALSPLH